MACALCTPGIMCFCDSFWSARQVGPIPDLQMDGAHGEHIFILENWGFVDPKCKWGLNESVFGRRPLARLTVHPDGRVGHRSGLLSLRNSTHGDRETELWRGSFLHQ